MPNNEYFDFKGWKNQRTVTGRYGLALIS